MKDSTELLTKLRKLMQKPPEYPEALSAYIVPSEDAHQVYINILVIFDDLCF